MLPAAWAIANQHAHGHHQAFLSPAAPGLSRGPPYLSFTSFALLGVQSYFFGVGPEQGTLKIESRQFSLAKYLVATPLHQ